MAAGPAPACVHIDVTVYRGASAMAVALDGASSPISSQFDVACTVTYLGAASKSGTQTVARSGVTNATIGTDIVVGVHN